MPGNTPGSGRPQTQRRIEHGRNAGIEHARGEYLTFCDPDDWVDADYLQQFVEAGMDEHTLPVTGILQHREGKSDRG